MVRISRTSEASTALYSSGSLRYRLRLCKQDRAVQLVPATEWTVCPSFWPEHIFLACNGQPVRPRRRQHFQHDVPIELSDLVCPGENTIEISLPEFTANMDNCSTYFMGVEVITTLDYEAVRDLVGANEHISVDETIREIQRRLKPRDSDDIIVEDDHIRVAVADPFSSCQFKTPVRGVDCKHIECFDLDIWLQTRSCKPSQDQAEPSVIDCWKCPICALDARPVSLRVDDFFAEVQRQLAQSDGVGTKHISIKADGSWNRIQEADEAETKAQGQPETKVPSADSTTQTVVILDDD
ncbi:MIZ/SP-RING zinc finger domain-containing protein [Hirsutella rhossiliensis]|uniref:MIZ/SP-RING zinc finger domain-containing protein n=1 Tax=Hirsutella rhossiliensis TaxID=111463 RepID=A0A9P8N5W1_9HYPO|nr:MIZ/SP-RING zinc finger domain-containing protein [Hirsutella rhossiliensis]KAH0967515.1 MIZ/SP-RING zinc finger domain-containing protein [Hirsutella rhossiliensis]